MYDTSNGKETGSRYPGLGRLHPNRIDECLDPLLYLNF